MRGECSSSVRKRPSVITSSRAGDVVVTVAVRGERETSAISPKKSPGPRVFTFRPPRRTVAFEQHEELAAAVALARQLLVLPDVDLVRDLRHLRDLCLAAVREQRHAADEVDLRVSSERHLVRV